MAAAPDARPEAVWARGCDDGRARAGAEARDADLAPQEAGLAEDKASRADREVVCEVEPADPDWDPPAHGRWVGRRELDVFGFATRGNAGS